MYVNSNSTRRNPNDILWCQNCYSRTNFTLLCPYFYHQIVAKVPLSSYWNYPADRDTGAVRFGWDQQLRSTSKFQTVHWTRNSSVEHERMLEVVAVAGGIVVMVTFPLAADTWHLLSESKALAIDLIGAQPRADGQWYGNDNDDGNDANQDTSRRDP